MAESTGQGSAHLPPRWVVTNFWKAHRTWYRATGGRRGLWLPGGKRGWGALRLTVPGRRSGVDRSVILGYLEDGSDLVTMAMNGWSPGEPAWWLNLQAHPTATVEVADGPPVQVEAHEAQGAERDRLWKLWGSVDKHLDEYAARRSGPTAVVVLSPASAPGQGDGADASPG